jgi:hypothetical protein
MDGILITMAQEGASIGQSNPQRWNLSVDVLQGGKRYERLYGDLLAVHQRKYTLGKMETFSSLASDEITSLWVKLCNLYRV